MVCTWNTIYVMKSTYQVDPVPLSSWCIQSSREAVIFPVSTTFCVAVAMYVARQQSLISNALFLTFATMCHYQKGLDFPGVTFRLEWDILYQYYQVKLGTSVWPSFTEMLRKHRVCIMRVDWKSVLKKQYSIFSGINIPPNLFPPLKLRVFESHLCLDHMGPVLRTLHVLHSSVPSSKWLYIPPGAF